MSRDEATGAIRALLILVKSTKVRVDIHDADPAWLDAALDLGGDLGEGRSTSWVTLADGQLTVFFQRTKQWGVA